ncbi:triose-phosphate isomerase [Aliibacillus thermotolerans]|uniref:Triosephosphate isomerase n=1 Tax=Aliibacillus thermotolerans TaxID=1834418 RepID=A0ABW0U5L3_9BACI|nr:triose-phosphate isomerase [Aliibacillus thermotolerans]MDA3128729.1 triose-phosphate isomerase [Aliibacillus thermotolerans]
MRTPIVAGNWKMHKTWEEAVQFTNEVKEGVPTVDEVETVVCAPALFLKEMVDLTTDSSLAIGAQTMHEEEQGAFTGEISPVALQNIGVRYVIIGHSERREMFNETDKSVNKKVHAAFKHGLIPIICCGETLSEYENQETKEVVTFQVDAALHGIKREEVKNVVIAYEPIWAIGTGKSSRAKEANETCRTIRTALAQQFGDDVAKQVRLLYGGSVKPDNMKSFMEQDQIDGALVGGASLEADSFLQLVEVAKHGK